MHKVLLVEDSEECCLVVKRALTGPNLQLSIAKNLQEAKKLLGGGLANHPDLIILDLSLPDGDGFELLNQLQTHVQLHKIPVFLMTSHQDITSKVTAFNLGAEDYLVKPVSPIELQARVEMRLRKISTKRKNYEILQKGALTFHISLMKTFCHDGHESKSIDLTTKEFKILLFLAQNEAQVYSRAELVAVIWGKSVHVLDRTVDSHICGLRRKLGDYSHYLESIPGAGYRFSAPPAANVIPMTPNEIAM